ncbi:M48 family metallopeptidase [Fulvivirga lutea]|uniref:M48 family metallopeptidase n=1 Tax=Fulvivirga lutea TaxID=2810512 RepID=A0A975A2A8_9BACT|nr:M48 family metallopeptidase [Fulvivirga lutea]QSE99261.1 M48 family metallopeptidase [Fulvivirga lutea]
MQYVGVQTQIWRNNRHSILLLIGFPVLLLGMVWSIILILNKDEIGALDLANQYFLIAAPYVIAGVTIWFLIAWVAQGAMIRKATGAKPLERKENMRVYNLVENLAMSRGMRTPKINIIEDDSLNAFASGLTEKNYTITLSSGIINKLDDKELEAVIAHELTHIINKDVRLLVISIIFVGIFSFIAEGLMRTFLRSSTRRSSSSSSNGKKGKGGGGGIALIVIVVLVSYLISLLIRFSISRKREFMADAGAVELTKNPQALASALRKISEDPLIEAVRRDDVAQMFIEHPKKKKTSFFSFFTTLFATHPPIEKRIETLEQF